MATDLTPVKGFESSTRDRARTRDDSICTHRDHALARVREKLAAPKRERKPFAERLGHACKKDRHLNALVFGTSPATTAMRVLLIKRCDYWRFEIGETATLLEALDGRTGEK